MLQTRLFKSFGKRVFEPVTDLRGHAPLDIQLPVYFVFGLKVNLGLLPAFFFVPARGLCLGCTVVCSLGVSWALAGLGFFFESDCGATASGFLAGVLTGAGANSDSSCVVICGSSSLESSSFAEFTATSCTEPLSPAKMRSDPIFFLEMKSNG